MQWREWMELLLGGGFLVTLFKYFLERGKNTAETNKTKAETKKITAELEDLITERWHREYYNLKREKEEGEKLCGKEIMRLIGECDRLEEELRLYKKNI